MGLVEALAGRIDLLDDGLLVGVGVGGIGGESLAVGGFEQLSLVFLLALSVFFALPLQLLLLNFVALGYTQVQEVSEELFAINLRKKVLNRTTMKNKVFKSY